MKSYTNIEFANIRPFLKRADSVFWHLAAIEMLSAAMSNSQDSSIAGYDFSEVGTAISAISQSAMDEIGAILAKLDEEPSEKDTKSI